MTTSSQSLLHYLRRLTVPAGDDAGDAVLLKRFASQGDESAFTALVARHGPMVLAVYRRILRNSHDAEDAFQATFLVLARKAGALRRPAALASWLYGTARHLAFTARRAESRHRQRELHCQESAAASPPADPLDDLSARELLWALDEELMHLPESYRLPLILCHLEGRTYEEAARLLGWTAGSVKGRLERGRKQLHARLSRRGLVLGASLLTLESMTTTTVSAALRQATVKRALTFAAGSVEGIAASIVTLAEMGAANMTMTKAKMGLILLLALSLAGGAGVLAYPLRSAQQAEDERAKAVATPERNSEASKSAKGEHTPSDNYGDPLPPDAVARMGTMRLRGIESTVALAYSPDGKIVASSNRNFGPVLLWDAATGKELHRLGDDLQLKGPIVFSPDGKLLAVPTYASRGAILWDVATGKEIRRLILQPLGEGHLGGLGCVAFSPDGKILAVPELVENSVHLIDVATGNALRKFKGNFKDVWSIAFSPDGKILAAGGFDKVIVLWETATGKKLHQLDAHKKVISSLAFSRDGKTLASASHDGTIRLWDTATGAEQRRFQCEECHGHNEAQVVLFVPGSRLLVAGSTYATHIWDLDTGKEVRRLAGLHALTDCPLAVSPDGKVLAADAGENGQIILWELATGKRLCPPGGHQRPIGSVAFSPDGKTLATGSYDETLRLWDVASGKEMRRFRLSFNVHVFFQPDGKTLAGGSDDRFLRFWEAATGKELRRFPTHKGGLGNVAFAADGKTCVTSGVNRGEYDDNSQTWIVKTTDTAIRRWRVDTGAEIGRFEGLAKAAGPLALAPDGKTMVSVMDNVATLWDVASCKEIRPLRGHQGWLACVVYSPDGRMVAAAGGDKVIHLWDAATGAEIRRLVGHENSIIAVRFSPDGRTLASGSHDRTVRLWEIATGQERRRFLGHRSAIFALDFSRDGRRLASAGLDDTALVWDATGRIAAVREGAAQLRQEELGRLWTELSNEKNAAHAFHAMRRLLLDPAATMRWFREHLHPVPAAQGEQIAHWIGDLDSAEFAVREKAIRELEQQGEAVEGALRRVLERRPPLEVRQRVKLLLEKMTTASRLRKLRAVEVLEHMDSAESHLLLEKLADGAADARLTEEAKASLVRLEARR